MSSILYEWGNRCLTWDQVEFLKSPFSLLLTTAPISVDTFFYISGLLITWIGMKEITKSKGKLNIPVMYLHRYLRLTPMLAIIMLFVVSLLKYCGTGPNWDYVISAPIGDWKIGWWRDMLYIQNYFDDSIVSTTLSILHISETEMLKLCCRIDLFSIIICKELFFVLLVHCTNLVFGSRYSIVLIITTHPYWPL